ncbi:MAG: hypothetical protein ABL907_17790, partial [Hyphomicrobium sp.]
DGCGVHRVKGAQRLFCCAAIYLPNLMATNGRSRKISGFAARGHFAHWLLSDGNGRTSGAV